MRLTGKNLCAKGRAFTLIELLIVVLIIGILLAIALPTFLGQEDKANDADAKAKLGIAYRVFKSVQASGQYSNLTASDLASRIADSEPELTVVSGVEGGGSTGQLNVSSITPATASAPGSPLTGLRADVRSKSGKLCIINLVGNGKPDISCGVPVGGGPGDGDEGGGDQGGGNAPVFASDLILENQDSSYVTQLFTADADNSNFNSLIDNPGYHPAFADGNTLYGVADDGALVSVAGDGSSTQVAPASAYCGGSGLISSSSYGPATTVAGTGDGHLNAVCGASGDYEIVRSDLDGANSTVLTSVSYQGPPPQITANADAAVYALGPPNRNAFSVPQTGGSPTQVTSTGDVQTLALSSTGTLAIWRLGPSGSNIWTLPVEGGNPTQLTTDGNQKWQMQFSPDGTTLAYVVLQFSGMGMSGKVYTIPTTGGSPIEISQSSDLSTKAVVWLR